MILNRSFAFRLGSHRCHVRHYSLSNFPVQQRKPAFDAVVSIGNAAVYPLGSSATKGSVPLLREFELVINEGEAWAVVGTSGAGKYALLQVIVYQELRLSVTETIPQTLLGHYKIHPPPAPPGGLYPFLSLQDPPRDPFSAVSLVSFSHRPKFSTGFVDYSARYGAVRDQDKLTLRQSLFPQLQAEVRKAEFNLEADNTVVDETQIRLLEYLIEKLDLTRLLDLPVIALSNGQTRKARIVKALIGSLGVTPELVVLDEGLSEYF